MRIFLLALMALFVMALPVMAVDDTGNVSVTVTVPDLVTSFDASGNFSFTADGDETGAELTFSNVTTISFSTNSTWDLKAYLGTAPTGWNLYIDGADDGGTWTQLTTTETTFDSGNAGASQSLVYDYKITGFNWIDDVDNDLSTTLTFNFYLT